MNLGDVLGGCYRASLDMYIDAVIELNSAMHLHTVIEQVWRRT